LEGVTSVSSGFSGFREINTVTYDPKVITTDKMVEVLEKAGTFRGIKE